MDNIATSPIVRLLDMLYSVQYTLVAIRHTHYYLRSDIASLPFNNVQIRFIKIINCCGEIIFCCLQKE